MTNVTLLTRPIESVCPCHGLSRYPQYNKARKLTRLIILWFISDIIVSH